MDTKIQQSLTKKIVQEAAIRYNIDPSTIKEIGGFENFVYEYEKNNENFILRFVHSSHRVSAQVEAELEFIDYLDKNNAIVSTVVHSVNDELIEIIPINDSEYFTICAFEKALGGHVKREDVSPEFYQYFGKEVGKLHRLTKKYNPIHRRIRWDEELYLDTAKEKLKPEDSVIVDRYLDVIKKIQSLPETKDNFGLIHTDLHFGNMFIHNKELTFFDWDDSSYKHFLSDIAIIIYYHFAFTDLSQEIIDQKTNEILVDFLKGYRKELEIDTDFFQYMNDFLMLRTIILYLVIHAAGEEMVDSVWGKQFITKYRTKIINNEPFLNLEKALKDI